MKETLADPALWHRIQFAFTITYHYLFPQLTMGLAWFLVYWKWRGLKTGEEKYNRAARFWAKIFGLNFAVGVVTGIPMEFQFGTNWAGFSKYAGGIIGQTLAMEGMFAFFLESAFIGALIWGEKRLGPRLHFFAAVGVATGSWLSGSFILVTNAFMQHPVGYTVLADGTLALGDVWAYLLNPWAFVQFAHNQCAAVVTGSFVVAAMGAYFTLRGTHAEQARMYLNAGTLVGLIASVLVAFPTGDAQAKMVGHHQPVTLAAMEGRFEGGRLAELTMIGQPNVAEQKLENPIPLPGALSFLAYGTFQSYVRGLTEFPKDQWPDNIELLYYAFHLMVTLGMIFIFLMALATFQRWRGRLATSAGLATNLSSLIMFRILQGLAGGGLQPSSQGILLDTFPAEKQGTAQTLFGIAALFAPVVGPTLGGWITDAFSWRWIFFINLPVGLLALGLGVALVHDPKYLQDDRAALKRQPFRFDSIGLALLVLAIAAWELLLSKGQEWDWLGDPFGRVHTLLIVFVLGVGGLVVWELRQEKPIVNFRPLRDRNFMISCVIIFCAFGVLYGSSTLVPALLESLFGYDAFHAGLVLSPSGFFAVAAVIVGGRLISKGFDARWLIGSGLLIVAAGSWWMSRMNLEIAPSQVIWPRVVLIIGLSLIFAPINVAAFLYIPRELRGAAVGLFALLRNEGGSFGTSFGKIITERREQMHSLRLNENLDPLNPAVTTFTDQTQASFLSLIGDPVAAKQMALQALDNLRSHQALALSYFDAFLIFAIASIALSFIVPLMRRSVVAKGVHVSAE